MGFDLKDVASIESFGAADGPTSILVSGAGLHHMAPPRWPPTPTWPLRSLTSLAIVATAEKERCIHMQYNSRREPWHENRFPSRLQEPL